MKKTNTPNLMMAVGIIAITTSCSTPTNISTAKTANINANVVSTPVIADLDVKDKKVVGTASYDREMPVDYVKDMAVATALKTVSADVLVEPNFDIQKLGMRTSVTVSGYPATYKNFRSAKAADSTLLKMSNVRSVSIYEPKKDMPITKKKGVAAGVILGGLLLGLIIVLAIAL